MKNSKNVFLNYNCYGKTWIMFFSFLLSLYSIGLAQEIHFPQEEKKLFVFPEVWQPIIGNEKINTLQMLTKISENTLKKINTIKGRYEVKYEQTIANEILSIMKISDHLSSSNIFQKYDFSLNICSDLKLEKTFYSKQIKRQIFESKGEKIEPDGLVLFDVDSIYSKKDYLFSIRSDVVSPKVSELPDFPIIEGKKIVWRDPPENMNNRTLVDLIDPCEYLHLTEWGNVNLILEAIEGKHGEENQKVSNNISLFEATDNKGVKWYRLHQLINSPVENIGKARELNVFWNQESGFHPICKLYTRPSHATLDLLQVRWTKKYDIFFPIESRIVVNKDNGELSYRRQMTLSDVEINKPIDPKQFSYSALGLSDDDILVDRIKQQVFTIQNNKPVYLAKFYEKYQTPHERSINRVRTIMMIAGFVLIVLGLYLKIRRKRSENTPK